MKRVNINRKLLYIEMGIKLYCTQYRPKKVKPFYAHPDKMRYSAGSKNIFSDINLQDDVQVFKLLFCLLLLLFNNFPSINNTLNHVSDRV